MLEDNNVDVVYVPTNCTDCLQPLDLSVNKPVKDFLKGKLELWYFDLMSEQGDSTPIKFPMQLMKPLGAQWMMDVHCYIQDHPEIIKNGFRAAGIDSDYVSMTPFTFSISAIKL